MHIHGKGLTITTHRRSGAPPHADQACGEDQEGPPPSNGLSRETHPLRGFAYCSYIGGAGDRAIYRGHLQGGSLIIDYPMINVGGWHEPGGIRSACVPKGII